MLDGKTWHCDKPYHDPYYERDGQEATPGGSSPTSSGPIDVSEFGAMEIRMIRREIIQKFGIKVECDKATGDPIKHYYPITINRGKEVVAWKIRKLPKDFTIAPSVGSQKVDLFGMQSSSFSPRCIVITEGELDAAAAYQMLEKHVQRLMCLSLPFGGNVKTILDNLDFLREADDVVFAGDQDDVGLKMLEKLSLILPTMRIMKYSEKDPCDMLKEGKMAEFRDAFGVAKTHRPSSIVVVADIKADALAPVKKGLDYPFHGLTTLTYGLPTKAIIGIGAGPGAGKTSFVKALQTHLIFKHKQPIGIFSLEETPAQTLRSLAGQIIGAPVHLPDCKYNEAELESAIQSLDGLVHIYDHHGYRDWDDIERAMSYMAHLGVKYQFIDPLSGLTAHLSASDANTYLNNAMFVMSKVTQSLDISVFHVNHLNNPVSGADHGAGGKVYGSQFTGSRAMWKFSTDMWGLERNQLAEDIYERNKVRLVILKNRLSGITGHIMLKYDPIKGRLEEMGAGSHSTSFTGAATGTSFGNLNVPNLANVRNESEEEDAI
jgi:twinkle protein